MSNLEDFAKTVQDKSPRTFKQKVEHPKGFNPSVSFSEKTKSGEIDLMFPFQPPISLG